MSHDFTKDEKKLLNLKTCEEYVDRAIKIKISPGRKAYISRLWLEKTGYESSDLRYARVHHLYWRKKKITGTLERTIIRLKKHDYKTGIKKTWNHYRMELFVNMNIRKDSGKYVYKDWELAKCFSCSIATIQHLRRKYNIVEKIVNIQNKINHNTFIDYMLTSEHHLRTIKKTLNKKRKN
ncbi:MAG: hypothetical protein V1874_02080 [Spirochaetota bacterium]